MKLKKLEGGGFLSYNPFFSDSGAESSQSATPAPITDTLRTTDTTVGILDRKTYDYLIRNGGLVNDINLFVRELSSLQNTSALPFADSDNTTTAIQMIGKINELRQSKAMWGSAVKHAESEGSLGEVAVGSSGEVYTKDKDNKVIALSLADYKKKRESVHLLTNNELLYERQYNPQLAGHDGILDVASSSVGLNKITDHIKSLITAFGTETIKDTQTYSKEQVLKQLGQMTGKRPTAEEAKAMQDLLAIANSPGEFVKVTTSNSTERRQAMKAAKYIWSTLGDAAQKKLAATASINGVASPTEFILDMIATQTDESKETIIEPDTVKIGVGATKSDDTTGANSEKNLTLFQLFHKDKLMNPNNTFALNDPIYSTMFRGVIGGISPIITPKGENVGMTTLENILQSGYNQFLKGDKVFFGNKKVSPTELQNIIYDGQDAAKVYMPVGADGQPDYNSLEQFKDIYTVFEANKNHWTAKQAEDYFKKNGYNLKVDTKYENGIEEKVIRENAYIKPFLVMYGYTNDATNLISGNDNWVTKLSKDEENTIVPRLEQIWTVGTGKKAINYTPKKAFNIEEYYKSVIAIPYRNDATAIVDAMVGLGPRERQTTMLDVQRNLLYSSNQPLNTNVSSTVLNNSNYGN